MYDKGKISVLSRTKEVKMCGECNWPLDLDKNIEEEQDVLTEWLEENGHEDFEKILDELMKQE